MRFMPLVRNGDFVRAYKRGKHIVHPQVVVYVNKNRGQGLRVGITCSKKAGKAVVRNRARRVIRQALVQTLSPNAGNVDVVLVARGQTPQLKSDRLAATLQAILPKLGLPTNG